MAIIDILKTSEIFSRMKKEQLEKIAPLCRSESFQTGAVVFTEGDEAKELYVLVAGKVAIEMNVQPVADRPAIPTAVDLIVKSEVFGWSSLVEPYRYTSTARCLANCAVLAIKGEVLRKYMSDDTSLGFELMTGLVQLVSRRHTNTRLRLISGIGLIMLTRELGRT